MLQLFRLLYYGRMKKWLIPVDKNLHETFLFQGQAVKINLQLDYKSAIILDAFDRLTYNRDELIQLIILIDYGTGKANFTRIFGKGI